MSNYEQKIATVLRLRPAQVAATIELLDAGNTLPFVARYRKEATGGLGEEQLRGLSELLAELVKIDPRSVGVGLYQHDVSQKWKARHTPGFLAILNSPPYSA
jgi:uncharacterized protein